MIEHLVQSARADIRQALSNGRPACVTSSFQAEDVALVHLIIEQAPDMPVLFLETGYHFAETLAYRDQIAGRFNLKLVNLVPKETVAEQETRAGRLFEIAPDQCCAARKVAPLFEGVAKFDTWFTGLRREQSPTRANLQVFEKFLLPIGKTLDKISPLAMWTNRDVWTYLRANDIPVLPLYDLGYTSIGCEPCTRLPLDINNPRSGRWAGQQKLECGIHISAAR